MSRLNPGGSRKSTGRIFGAKAIERACQHKEHGESNSPAGKPHGNNREIERRLRQQARRGGEKAMKVRLRYTRRGWLRWYPFTFPPKGRGVWCGPFATAEDARWMAGFAAVV